jgi:hypothetical protein
MRHNKIIYYPKKLPFYRKKMEQLLKVALSLFTVLTTLILWAQYGSILHNNLFSGKYLGDTYQIVKELFFLTIGAFFVMIGWQFYNIRAFGRKQRRSFSEQSPDSALAKLYSIGEESISCLRDAQTVWLEKKTDGNTAWSTSAITVVSGTFNGEKKDEIPEHKSH